MQSQTLGLIASWTIELASSWSESHLLYVSIQLYSISDTLEALQVFSMATQIIHSLGKLQELCGAVANMCPVPIGLCVCTPGPQRVALF